MGNRAVPTCYFKWNLIKSGVTADFTLVFPLGSLTGGCSLPSNGVSLQKVHPSNDMSHKVFFSVSVMACGAAEDGRRIRLSVGKSKSVAP